MPIFFNKSSQITVSWTYDPTRLVKHDDPNFAHLEATAHAELNKVQDFVAYKNMQNQQNRTDLAKLTQHAGRVILPAARQKIGPDKSALSSMSHLVGADWPSLRHDFGVSHPETDARSAEFRINFEHEVKPSFPSLDPLLGHFSKLGQNIDEFQEMLIDMRQTELEIFDTQKNPHPTDRFGRKKNLDFLGAQLQKRNELRYHYQYNFNKIADENGVYLHVRFETQNQYTKDRSAFNQDLVFVFPTSNEERTIWRHVFWNEEYPAAGFPVETGYARQLAEMQKNSRNPFFSVDKLTAEFSRMNVPAPMQPPSYSASMS